MAKAGNGPLRANADHEEGWVQRKLAGRLRRAAEEVATAASGGAVASSPARVPPSIPDEKRVADRRSEERRTGVTSRARVAFRGREHDVAVLNLSRRGAMIDAEVGAATGERIAICFPECHPIHGIVRWVDEGRTGIEFARQTALLVPANWRLVAGRRSGEAPSAAAPRTRPPRHKLMWECELHWTRGVERSRIRNISPDGAMIDGSRNVPVGTEVTLALRGAGTIAGTVRWCRSGQAGIEFERPFDLRKVLAPAGITTSAGSPSRPGMLKPLYLETELDPSSPWAARKDKLQRGDLG